MDKILVTICVIRLWGNIIRSVFTTTTTITNIIWIQKWKCIHRQMYLIESKKNVWRFSEISAWKVVCLSMRMDYSWTWSVPLTLWRLMITTMDCVHKLHCHLYTFYRLPDAPRKTYTPKNNYYTHYNGQRYECVAFTPDIVWLYFLCVCSSWFLIFCRIDLCTYVCVLIWVCVNELDGIRFQQIKRN